MSNQQKRVMVLHAMCEAADYFQELLAGNEDADVISLDEGPRIVRSSMDHAMAGLDSVRKVKEAEKNGYGAVIMTCHGDPNLYALRESVRIPVLGTLQVAMHVCSLLGRRFSIIGTKELYSKRLKEDLVVRYGFESKLASIRQVPFEVPLDEVGRLFQKRPIPPEVINPVVSEVVKAVEEDDATAITFGCGFLAMAEQELVARLKDRDIDIPVINPLPIALEMARLLIKNNLTHSILAFPLAEHYELGVCAI
ncbi:aspartate/glutamate racemase family protein [Chloroflexota bacterium]